MKDHTMTQQNTKLLNDYSQSLGLSESMTLQGLIDSHAHLRNLNIEKRELWHKEIEAGRELGKNQGREMVTHGEYVHVAKLKQMTVTELVDFLHED